MSKNPIPSELSELRLLSLTDLAPVLGVTPTALRIRIHRGGIETGSVPPPLNMDGTKYFWSIMTVRDWLTAKADRAKTNQVYQSQGRGRPRLPRENRRAA